MIRIGDKINFDTKEFYIKEYLGQGGMGQVFLVKDTGDNELFALKYLMHYIPDDNFHLSLMNEWDKAKTIEHPNVIRYLDFNDGTSSNLNPFLLIELAKDGTLEDLLKSRTELFSEPECLQIFNQIIDGMEAVNDVLVHRDLKPENIFINDNVIKIADFGLAKIAEDKTRSKTFKGWGTAPYIAPEAYRSEKNTIQMDMYSIGLIFYQIAALVHAYGNQTDWELAHLTSTATPVNQINNQISPSVAKVIQRLINKKPNDRYADWEGVRKDLQKSQVEVGKSREHIDNILSKKLAKETLEQKTKSAEQTKRDEINRVKQLISYQLNNDILDPLKEFVEHFNEVSSQDQEMLIIKTSRETKLSFDSKSIRIQLKVIDKGDSRIGQTNDFGYTREVRYEPTLYNKKIKAWGSIESSQGKGINIILVCSESSEYGDWHTLSNSCSVMVNWSQKGGERPAPFAFSMEELKKEIHTVGGGMHIYNTKVQKLDIESVIEFISNEL